MQVIKETSNNLTLRLRPWFVWFFGGIFGAAGLATAVFGGQVNAFSCRRVGADSAVCKVSSNGLFGSNQKVLLKSDIHGTRIDSRDEKKGNSYRLMLLTSQGEISVIPQDFYNYETVDAWASQIEVFLNTSLTKQLVIQEDYRLLGYFFGGIFILVGYAIVASFGRVVICTFDKSLGTFTLQQRGLLHQRKLEYWIRDILSVVVEKYRGNKGSITYRVAIVMECGDRIPFTFYYSSQFQELQQTANRICKFLNLKPMQDRDIPSSFQATKEVFWKVGLLGRFAFMGKKKRQAKLAELRKAILFNPNNAEAHYQLGFALYSLNQYDQAKPVLERAQRLYSLEGEGQKVQQINVMLDAIAYWL
jgi:tetratricopeptide (TPR) repeat protein